MSGYKGITVGFQGSKKVFQASMSMFQEFSWVISVDLEEVPGFSEEIASSLKDWEPWNPVKDKFPVFHDRISGVHEEV